MRLFTLVFSILNLLIITRGAPSSSDASLVNNCLPRDLLLLIFEYTEDLSLSEVSKYWYELVQEKYRRRLPKNIPEFADFLRNRKNHHLSLPKAKRFLNQRFNSEILPLLWSTWQDPTIDVNSIDNPDECFELVIAEYLLNQLDENEAETVWTRSKLAYDVLKNRLPGYDPWLLRGLSMTPLHQAILDGNEEEVLRILSKEERSPNLVDNQGWTPLILAASLRNIRLIRLLARYGADPLIALEIPELPLHVAAYSGFIDVLKELIDIFKIDISIRNCRGETCLHSACENGQTEVVRYLVEVLGADIDAVTDYEETALHCALKIQNLEIIQILLDHGANQCICDRNHNYPIHDAAETGFLAAVNLLLDRFPDGFEALGLHNETALHVACRSGSFNVAQCLLDRDFDVNAADGYGFTPLHQAISQMNTALLGDEALQVYSRIVEMLICRRANLNAVDEISGNTPLHLACERGIPRIVKMLLGGGHVDLSIRNRDGRTALDVARKHDHLPIKNLIADYQTRLNQRCFRIRAFALLTFILGLLYACPDLCLPLLLFIFF